MKRKKWIITIGLLLGTVILLSYRGTGELTAEQVIRWFRRYDITEQSDSFTYALLRINNVIFTGDTAKTVSAPAVRKEEKQPEKEPVQSNPEPVVRNQTSFDLDTAALLRMPLEFLPLKETEMPQVLIVHTHTTEGYAPEERTGNPEKNVTAVGDVIAERLEQAGIGVIHDKTVHDRDYNGSYARSAETVEQILKQNPTVQIVLDVHRDAAVLEDGQSLRVCSETDGAETGQIMLVAGTDGGGLEHPVWQNNLAFALRIQQAMDSLSPGLSRPLNVRNERFNQHLAPGMLIVEVAASGNSLEEAKRGAELFSDALLSVLR